MPRPAANVNRCQVASGKLERPEDVYMCHTAHAAESNATCLIIKSVTNQTPRGTRFSEFVESNDQGM